MRRTLVVAIIALAIVATAVGILAVTSNDTEPNSIEDSGESGGKKFSIDLNEDLKLKEKS